VSATREGIIYVPHIDHQINPTKFAPCVYVRITFTSVIYTFIFQPISGIQKQNEYVCTTNRK